MKFRFDVLIKGAVMPPFYYSLDRVVPVMLWFKMD